MQWENQLNAGFSKDTPWLPVHTNYPMVNAAAALADEDSLFYTYKHLIHLRKQLPVIVVGKYEKLETGNAQVLAYKRFDAKESVIVVVNFSASVQNYQLSESVVEGEILIHNYPEHKIRQQLEPYEAYAVRKTN